MIREFDPRYPHLRYDTNFLGQASGGGEHSWDECARPEADVPRRANSDSCRETSQNFSAEKYP